MSDESERPPEWPWFVFYVACWAVCYESMMQLGHDMLAVKRLLHDSRSNCASTSGEKPTYER